MDNPLMRYRLQSGAGLMHWVVNVDSFESIEHFNPGIWGTPMPMQRDQLNWQIALPDDGRLPGGGLLPTVICWQSEHPAPNMEDLGCQIQSLTLYHPQPGWLKKQLDAIAADEISNLPITIEEALQPHFSVNISTPDGERTLRSH